MMIGVFAIMWLVVLRPQQRERKAMEARRKMLKKGDRVMTQGGVIAKVQQVKDGGEIVLDLDGSARMTVLLAAITTVFPDGTTATTAVKDKEAAARA
jgi:preprotein translocase subunit YajC